MAEAAMLASDEMPAPCYRCGATKTDPVRRGIIGHFARVFGYRLRKCARCRRRRLVHQRTFKRPGLPLPSYVASSAGAARNAPASAVRGDFDPDGFDGCPRCGGRAFGPAPRKWLERALGWAPMARCRACGRRFTFPQP